MLAIVIKVITWSAEDIYVNKLSACLAMNTASKRIDLLSK